MSVQPISFYLLLKRQNGTNRTMFGSPVAFLRCSSKYFIIAHCNALWMFVAIHFKYPHNTPVLQQAALTKEMKTFFSMLGPSQNKLGSGNATCRNIQ